MICSRLFHPKAMSNFNLRQRYKFTIPLTNSVYSGAESISFLSLNILELVPSELRKEFRCFQIFYEKLTALKLSV